MIPGKEMNDVSSNGSVPGMVPSNVPAMNNPIPNPNMVPAINQGGSGAAMVPTLQRKNSFEDANVGLHDSGDMAAMRNDPNMQYMDKSRNKRARPASGKTPPGPIPTNALPSEAFLNSQRAKLPPSQRRRASAYNIQTGAPGYASMEGQGNGQSQSTPPNHSSPPSPSDVLPDSPSGQNKGNYNPSYIGGGYYNGGYNSVGNPQYGQNPSNPTNAYGSISNSGQYTNQPQYTGQNPPANYAPYVPQQTFNGGQTVPSGYGPAAGVSYSYGSGTKGIPNGSFAGNSVNSQQKSIQYVHPGRANIPPGMILKNKQYVSKSGNHTTSHDHPTEDTDSMPSDKDSAFQSLGMDTSSMLSDPMYRTDTDPMYNFGTEPSIDSDTGIDMLL
jgi:hypothetical protein